MNRYKSTYCVIMAGGAGTRFWPMSRGDKPKQFIDILGTGRTMIQATMDRFEALLPASNFLVMTGDKFETEVLKQLPGLQPNQVLTEPERRNTAPAIAYAAYKIYQNDPDAIMVVTPADHYITEDIHFRNCIKEAIDYVREHEALLTIGITPTYPATGYGYIEMSQEVLQNGVGKVERFKEKPQLEEAKQLIASKKYLWNSGMFVWRVKDIIKALETYLPLVAVLFAEIDVYDTPQELRAVAQAIHQSPAISIDYGVMEKADNVATIVGNFEWSDIGTWQSLHHFMEKNKLNLQPESSGREIHLEDSPNTLVRLKDKNKNVVVIGLEDYLVVDMDDLLFIAPKSNEADLHTYINKYAALLSEEE